MHKLASFSLLILFLFASLAQAEPDGALIPISHIPDPPPAIDGSLERFESVAGWIAMDQKAKVTTNADAWTGPEDLSANVIAAWDRANFYLAAKIVDAGYADKKEGSSKKGNYILLSVEVPKRSAAQRSSTTVYQMEIRPQSADSAIAGAELLRRSPKPGAVSDARCSAQVVENGYWVETAIPWEQLGLSEGATEGTLVGVNVALHSVDPGSEGKERVMTLLSATSDDSFSLGGGVLAASDGTIDPAKMPKEAESISDLIEVESGGKTELTLNVPEEIRANVKELVVRARLETKKVAGGAPVMRVFLNDVELLPERCRDRGETFELGVKDISTFAKNRWFLLYSPDFELPPATSTYVVRGVNPYEFSFDVTDLWRVDGENKIRIEHANKALRPMRAEILASTTLSPKIAPPPLLPAPTGPLATVEPVPPLAEGKMSAHLLPGGAVSVSLAGLDWVTQSSFSTTEPAWVEFDSESAEGWKQVNKRSETHFEAENDAYRISRKLKVHTDHVTVLDTYKNLSGADEPILMRHWVAVPQSERKTLYLNGRVYPTETRSAEEPVNPTTLALTEKGGVGLVSEDDVMRVQSANYFDADTFGIRNHRFVLAAGKEITLEFSIYPLEQADRFLFINRVREIWGTNRTIPGAFAVLHSYRGLLGQMEKKEEMIDYLKNKDVIMGTVSFPYRGNVATQGGRAFEIDLEPTRAYVDRLHDAMPSLKVLPYYHSFISNGDGDRETFADVAVLGSDGEQEIYGNKEAYPIFVPIEGSTFAKNQEKLIELRFEKVGADGIYWDEFEYSQAKFQFFPRMWDGVTGVIDLRTHKLSKKISSVVLLGLPWRMKTAKAILERGPLVFNGQAMTRTSMQLDVPRFIETGSINNLTKGQLGYPIALGDHLTERTEKDSYRNMVKGLDYSSLYYWYGPYVVATHRTLTQHMFPATPVALGEGYLIAKERILTNRSGLFGWGDNSDFEAHVYDRNGYETEEITVPKVEKGGRTYAEVRIPEGYAVALVRIAQ